MVDELDELDVVVTRIGQFGYNEFGVCVEGAINVIAISINSGKVYAYGEVGQTPHGWTYGCSEGTKFTHDGSGGSSHGIYLDSRYQYRTREEASAGLQYELLRSWENEKKKAPTSAAKVYQKAIDVLTAQIGSRTEPKSFDIDYDNEFEPIQDPTRSITSPKQPLQYQLF